MIFRTNLSPGQVPGVIPGDLMGIISIDPSLRQTGIYDEFTDTTHIIKTGLEEEGVALNKIYTVLTNGIRKRGPCIIVYEGNSCFGSLGYGASSLFAVIGIIRMIAAQQGCVAIEMPVQTWKTFIFGKARKEWPTKGNKARHYIVAYLSAVEAAIGRHFETTDEADAFMIYKTFKERGVPVKKKKFKKPRKCDIIPSAGR